MANGECYIGATNAANIIAQAQMIESTNTRVDKVETNVNKRVDKVEAKQDWMIYLLIINLVAVVTGYIF